MQKIPDLELHAFATPPGGLHIRWPDASLEQEARLFDYRWWRATCSNSGITSYHLDRPVKTTEASCKSRSLALVCVGLFVCWCHFKCCVPLGHFGLHRRAPPKARLGARLSRYLEYHAERQQPWRVNFAFAKVSEQVHGYGHVKAWRLAAARTQWDLWVKRFHRTQAQAA